jgi:translation initiation factor 6 (eIF-6)
MLNQQPMMDITLSNWDQVRTPATTVQSHSIQFVRDNIRVLNDLHCLETAVERLELIHSLLAGNNYHFLVADYVEGGVHGPNPKQSEFKTDSK